MTPDGDTSTSLPARVCVAQGVLFQDLADEVVLLNSREEHYYGLNGVGERAWQLISEQSDTHEVLAQLLDEYDVEEATLRQEFASLLQELSSKGLVTFDAP